MEFSGTLFERSHINRYYSIHIPIFDHEKILLSCTYGIPSRSVSAPSHLVRMLEISSDVDEGVQPVELP